MNFAIRPNDLGTDAFARGSSKNLVCLLRLICPVSLLRVALLCLCTLVGCVFVSPSLTAQSDRGTLTGIVADPTGAVIPKSTVVARNLDTGAETTVDTTSAGSYTLASLPAGKYQLRVEATGFRSFVQNGITISVAQTVRQDVHLALGAAAEVVTVNSDASLLKTENAEQSTTISRKDLLELPIPFVQSGAIRDPLAFAKLTPGTSVPAGSNAIRVNGLPSSSFKISVDGMDSTNQNLTNREDGNHPSVDAVEEFTIQTSNFAAEFGQVSGGLFNFTARSGTNQYHGSAYDYFTNEDLNAGRPFSVLSGSSQIQSIRQKTRQNDYGFTFGGPVRIPHLYDGRDRTFFFFNLEEFRLDQTSNISLTVPTDNMRNGDFHEILTGKRIGTDPLGRPIMENTIYDPATARSVNGQIVTDPFPGNIIPTSRFDPVALKVQALVPTAQLNTCSGGVCINNYNISVPTPTRQRIPAFKIDQVINQKLKASFYFSQFYASSVNGADGLPVPLSGFRPGYSTADVYRLNTDYTATPNLLFHAGAGFTRAFQLDGAPASISNYDALAGIGLKNTVGAGFPFLGGLGSNFGGIRDATGGLGPTQRNQYQTDKANGIASVIYTRGNHSIKGGADYKNDMYIASASAGSNNVAGSYGFNGNETALPYQNSTSFTTGSGASATSGAVGFTYASFLLGQVDSGSIGNANVVQYHRPTYALYLQDTWKARKNLTIDYGMRWDFTETFREHQFRSSGFSPTALNPGANNLPGALAFEGFGIPGSCNCYFAPHYPYSIGPRLGIAFQADPTTVFRGGIGVTYGQAAAFDYAGTNFQVVSVGINTVQFTKTTGFGTPVTTLAQGPQYNPAAITDASRNPAFNCCSSINQSPSPYFDRNGSKPPRIVNYTFSMQKEINKDLAVEVSYVGNRAIWLVSGDQGNLGLLQLNAQTAARLSTRGLDVTNPVDGALLNSTFASGAPQKRGFTVPYPSFPTGATLAQALRPFPQYGTIYTEYSPTGKSWYDALQVKVTKRLSHGLQLLNSFTWSKELEEGTDTVRGQGAQINDALNRPSNKFLTSTYQPIINVTSFVYNLPYYSFGNDSLLKRELLGGWTVGGIFRYSNGALIRIPGSGASGAASLSSLLLRGTYANRVPGVPLFNKNPNCHCFNPTQDALLNPNAWTEPALGTFSNTSAYDNDYRWQRQPDEEANIGKRFTIGIHRESPATLQIRAEFFNVFNRTLLPQPASSGYLNPVTGPSSFGRISYSNVLGSAAYRTGQLVARFEF